METRAFTKAPTSVKQARRFVVEQLPDVAGDIADAVALMVSELATNCIRHAGIGFAVTVDVGAERVRVVVADGGPGAPHLRSPSPSDPHGRGLQIVAECSDDWGYTTSPDTGTTVWFSVRLGADQESASRASSDRSSVPGGDRVRAGAYRAASEHPGPAVDRAGGTGVHPGEGPTARRHSVVRGWTGGLTDVFAARPDRHVTDCVTRERRAQTATFGAGGRGFGRVRPGVQDKCSPPGRTPR